MVDTWFSMKEKSSQKENEAISEPEEAQVATCPSPHDFDVTGGEGRVYQDYFSTKTFQGRKVAATPYRLSETVSFTK